MMPARIMSMQVIEEARFFSAFNPAEDLPVKGIKESGEDNGEGNRDKEGLEHFPDEENDY